MANVKNIKIKEQTGTDGLLYATWEFYSGWAKNLDKFRVYWYYGTGDGIWFSGSNEDTGRYNATYTPPSNATSVKVSIKPISKQDSKKKYYWTGEYRSQTFYVYKQPPEPPTTEPTLEDASTETQMKIKVSCSTDDPLADQVKFILYRSIKNEKTGKWETKQVASDYAPVTSQNEAAKTFVINYRNATYYARYQLYNTYNGDNGKKIWNGNPTLSPYSDPYLSAPHQCTSLIVKPYDETNVKLTWECASGTGNYEIEYTKDKNYFDRADGVQKTTSEKRTRYIEGLELGEVWYFRVRAINKNGKAGLWSAIKSTTIGKQPQPPTTWSTTTKAKVGDTIRLYWTHNAEDNSDMSGFTLSMKVGKTTTDITSKNSIKISDPDSENPIYYYEYPATEEETIKWKVRTKGVIATYSNWSVERTIDVFTEPTVELVITDHNEGDDASGLDTLRLNSFPLDIDISTAPETQTPISHHIYIKPALSYRTEDDNGKEIIVSRDDVIFSRIITEGLNAESYKCSISAVDVKLEEGNLYHIYVDTLMNSGLRASAKITFIVNWDDVDYIIDGAVNVDFDNLTAHIRANCYLDDGTDDLNLAPDVEMSLYRRDYNGEFTLIEGDFPNDSTLMITDPHPSLDYARYRIVARNIATGQISYVDLVSEPVGEPGIVINWDEDWSQFNYYEDEEPIDPPWSGSLLRLPYNVDVNEGPEKDVAHINYIGRTHPVSYYGTQRNENATWSTEIPKTDKETLYALRRLAIYKGDVYVRESSGVGYWATVAVDMNIKHRELTIPVTFNVVRVEGGA